MRHATPPQVPEEGTIMAAHIITTYHTVCQLALPARWCLQTRDVVPKAYPPKVFSTSLAAEIFVLYAGLRLTAAVSLQ
jgi:hypothetical protein